MTVTEINFLQEQKEILVYNSQSVELLSQFRNSETWFSKSDLVESMTELLGQHALPYFSPLKAAFLFQFKSIDSLSYYSPVLARDGALMLAHFFLKNPEVTDHSIQIIIHEKLSNLVPASWQKNVLTYSIRSLSNFKNFDQKRSSLALVATMLGAKQNSKEYLDQCLQKFTAINKTAPQRITLVCACPQTACDPQTQEALLKNYSELVFEISKIGIPVNFKSTEQLKGENLTDFYFQDLNEFLFYYSDSFISQLLLSHGALDLSCSMSQSQAPIATFPLSFYHELLVQHFVPSVTNPELSVETFRRSQTLSSIEAHYSPEEVSFSSKLCSQAFEGFAYEMARKLVK
jgi:hypothetical protein